ncbi:MAG: hypothetical protein ABL890_00680 [Candidatus Peribacteraceae bacterium]
MNRFFIIPVLTLAIASSGCSLFQSNATDSTGDSSSSSSDTVYVPTPNVTYVGSVESNGEGIMLQLSKGGMITLIPSDQGMDLSKYIGQEVQVRGAVTPTGSTLTMLVAEVTLLDDGSSGESSAAQNTCGGITGALCAEGFVCQDDSTDSCDPTSGGADCMGICVQSSASSSIAASVAASSASVRSSSSSVAPKSSAAPVESSSSSSDLAAPTTTNNAEMAKQDYSAQLWTQKYCTSHIAFCIPVHKNWYFKSFGATTSNLWHVEFGMTAIESIGMGSIVLNLVDTSLEAAGATDGSVVRRGDEVIGFAEWTDGTHFEMIADASLQSAVSYMISRITPYTP